MVQARAGHDARLRAIPPYPGPVVSRPGQVTLMRTTAAENQSFGRFIAARLNQMEGPVRFLLPLKGVSQIDAPGQPFHDPAADRMLFDTLESEFRPGSNRRLIKLDMNINDPAFAKALVDHFLEIVPVH